MQITKDTAAYLNAVTAYTGNVVTQQGQDGKEVQTPERRTSVPAQYQRNRNSVHAKIVGLTEVPLVDEAIKNETFKLDDPRLEWVKNSVDFKAPEGKALLNADRFTDGECELTDGEKKFVAFCLKGRDELPVVSDAVLDEFEALTKSA